MTERPASFSVAFSVQEAEREVQRGGLRDGLSAGGVPDRFIESSVRRRRRSAQSGNDV